MTIFAQKPQPADPRNVSQSDILNNFIYLQTSVGNDHNFTNNTVNTNDGLHKQSTYFVSPDPSTSTTQVATYCKNDVNGNPQLWIRPINNGTPVQLTATPKLGGTVPTSATNGATYLPGTTGVLLQWGQATNKGVGSIITFPISFSAVPYSITLTPFNSSYDSTSHGAPSAISATQAQFTVSNGTGQGSTYNLYWMAIGPA